MKLYGRLLPPVACQISFRDLGSSFIESIYNKDLINEFAGKLSNFLGVRHVYFVNYGRNALYFILKAIKNIAPERKEIIVPAYICPSVGLAVRRAGLELKLCEISKDDLRLDQNYLKKIISSNTLALIVNHLFGYPSNVHQIKKIAQESNFFVIEDAAQACGATLGGKKVGALGNFGFFSLGLGKNFTVGNGGIIVTDSDELSREIETVMKHIKPPGLFCNFNIFLKVFFYSLLIRPELFPFTEVVFDKVDYNNSPKYFVANSINNFQAALGLKLLERLDGENLKRIERCEYLYKALNNLEEIKVFKPLHGSRPAYIRFPILFDKITLRNKISNALYKKNIKVGRMYGRTLNKFKEFSDLKTMRLDNSEYIADRLLTLPIHSFVKNKDLDFIIETIKNNV